jgi:hypothetical protein
MSLKRAVRKHWKAKTCSFIGTAAWNYMFAFAVVFESGIAYRIGHLDLSGEE